MIRRPPRSTRTMNRRQRQMCIRDSVRSASPPDSELGHGLADVQATPAWYRNMDYLSPNVMSDTFDSFRHASNDEIGLLSPADIAARSPPLLMPVPSWDDLPYDRPPNHMISENKWDEYHDDAIAPETPKFAHPLLSLIHISEPTRHFKRSRMPSSA